MVLEGGIEAKVVVAVVFLALSAGGFLHAFVWRFVFCTHVCPIGLYYRYVTSKAPIGIVFSEVPSSCIECGACEKVCPVDLDPRRLGVELESTGVDGPAARYGDAECIRCGDCIEACGMVFKSRPGETAPLRFGRTHEVEGVPVEVSQECE